MSKKPYEPMIQVKVTDLYDALVMGDQDILEWLTRLAHNEHRDYLIAVTKNPRTPAEWDEWERRRK